MFAAQWHFNTTVKIIKLVFDYGKKQKTRTVLFVAVQKKKNSFVRFTDASRRSTATAQ